MKIIPTKQQWKKWSMPSKASYIGVPIAILIFIIALAIPKFHSNYSKKNYEILDEFTSNYISDEEIKELIFNIERDLGDRIDPEVLKEYAEIIKSIYERTDTTVSIKLNETIYCEDIKELRIVDLAIYSNISGHKIFIAIKLLPGKDPITIDIIRYYKKIFDDVKASKGVIICNGGYSDKAFDYAKNNMIDLCMLKDATSRKWNNDISIPVFIEDIVPSLDLEFNVSFEEGDKIHKDFTKAILSENLGDSNFTIPDYFMYLWNNNKIPHYSDSLIECEYKGEDLKVRVNTNDWRSFQFTIFYKTIIKYYLKYFIPDKYEAIENYINGNVTISEIDLLITYKKNDSTWIQIDPDSTNINKSGIIITMQDSILTNEDIGSYTLESIKKK